MEIVDKNTFVVTAGASGRRYVVRRRNRAAYRGAWDVCNAAGGCYGTFATLPGARNWARQH